ncbi:MAG TPA: 2-keto-4-pentenoate hydratase [Stellaceae bacterium]|jgi:2-keto-4-pentenoate hydratase
MLAQHVEEAARLLCEARAAARPLAELPPDCRPRTDADAYRIQDAVVARLGEAVGGWKVRIATITGAALCAPIFARTISPSPASFRGTRPVGVEAVLAFRLGRDLPPRAEVFHRAEATEGASLHPAVELIEPRYADFRARDRAANLADNWSNGGLVLGGAIPDWRSLEMTHIRIEVRADGEPVAASGRSPPRDPVAALVDCANLLGRRGGAKAGTVVAVMPWTELVFVAPGSRVAVDFGPLGQIDIDVPAAG